MVSVYAGLQQAKAVKVDVNFDMMVLKLGSVSVDILGSVNVLTTFDMMLDFVNCLLNIRSNVAMIVIINYEHGPSAVF